MFKKIIAVLKEVFWLKSPPKKKTIRRKSVARKTARKKAIVPKPAAKRPAKPKKILHAKPVTLKKSKPLKLPMRPKIDPNLKLVGEVTHYFDRIKVCVVKVAQGTVLIGDKLTVIGPKTRFVQKVWSMQIESEDVKVAKKGQLIGLKVDKAVAVGDKVYK